MHIRGKRILVSSWFKETDMCQAKLGRVWVLSAMKEAVVTIPGNITNSSPQGQGAPVSRAFLDLGLLAPVFFSLPSYRSCSLQLLSWGWGWLHFLSVFDASHYPSSFSFFIALSLGTCMKHSSIASPGSHLQHCLVG